jgi:hypothetical protein
MKDLLLELGSPGVDEFFFQDVPTLLQDMSIITRMGGEWVKLYFYRNLWIDHSGKATAEDRKRALAHFRKRMKTLRGELSVGNRSVSQVLGKDALLFWAIAPAAAFGMAVGDKLESVLSPVRDSDRIEQWENMESFLIPTLGIDMKSPRYAAVKTRYIEEGYSGGVMAYFNKETGMDIYKNVDKQEVISSKEEKPRRSGYSSQRFSDVFFGNMRMNEADERAGSQNGDLVRPILLHLRSKNSKGLTEDLEKYLQTVLNDVEKIESVQTIALEADNLNDFIQMIKSEQAGSDKKYSNFDTGKFLKKLEDTAKSGIEKIGQDGLKNYIEGKAPDKQEQLQTDEDFLVQEFMTDLFGVNFLGFQKQIIDETTKNLKTMRKDINKDFDPEFWGKEFKGNSKVVKKYVAMVSAANEKIKELLDD